MDSTQSINTLSDLLTEDEEERLDIYVSSIRDMLTQDAAKELPKKTSSWQSFLKKNGSATTPEYGDSLSELFDASSTHGGEDFLIKQVSPNCRQSHSYAEEVEHLSKVQKQLIEMKATSQNLLKRRSLTLKPKKTVADTKQSMHEQLNQTLEAALKISKEADMLSSETQEQDGVEDPTKASQPDESHNVDPSKITEANKTVAPTKTSERDQSHRRSLSTSDPPLRKNTKTLRKSKSLDNPSLTTLSHSKDVPRRGRRKSGGGLPRRGVKAQYSGDELYPAMKPTRSNGSRKPSRLEADLVFDAKQMVSQRTRRPNKKRHDSKEFMEITTTSNHSTDTGISSLGMGSNGSVSSGEEQQPVMCFQRQRRPTVCSLPSVDTALLGTVVLDSSSPATSGSCCTNSNDDAPRRPVRRRSMSPPTTR